MNKAFAAFLARQLSPRALAAVAAGIPLEDWLRRVQQGHLDIVQAHQLLRRVAAESSPRKDFLP
jgi:hypothetical protein